MVSSMLSKLKPIFIAAISGINVSIKKKRILNEIHLCVKNQKYMGFKKLKFKGGEKLYQK